MGKVWIGLGAISLLALASCSGKKRDFADGVASVEFGSAGASPGSGEQAAVAAPPITSGVDACTSDAECESGRCLEGACSEGSGDTISGLGGAELASPMPRIEEVCGLLR